MEHEALRLLIDSHLKKARFLGKVSGFQAAERVVAEALVKKGKSAALLRLRAEVHAALHRFERARLDLISARRVGDPPRAVDFLEAKIRLARGYLDLIASQAKPMKDWRALFILAEPIGGMVGSKRVTEAMVRQSMHMRTLRPLN